MSDRARGAIFDGPMHSREEYLLPEELCIKLSQHAIHTYSYSLSLRTKTSTRSLAIMSGASHLAAIYGSEQDKVNCKPNVAAESDKGSFEMLNFVMWLNRQFLPQSELSLVSHSVSANALVSDWRLPTRRKMFAKTHQTAIFAGSWLSFGLWISSDSS